MRLEAIVPNFKAETTKGPINFYDWQRSSWVVLFSHPADFTPVCTSELGCMVLHANEFAKRNTKCLAHSVHTLSAHLIWINDIKKHCSSDVCSADIPYPIIADPKRDLAVLFGMLGEEEKNDPEINTTIRALYIIDPAHRLRLSAHYPVSCGRNIQEILRSIDSLQLTDHYKIIATPEKWTPGDMIMIVPSISDEDAKRIFPKGFKSIDLPSGLNYLRCTKDYCHQYIPDSQ